MNILNEGAFTAHRGKCPKCEGVVLVGRNKETFEIEPSQCWCIQCGEQFILEVKDIKEWERLQFEQKEAGIGKTAWGSRANWIAQKQHTGLFAPLDDDNRNLNERARVESDSETNSGSGGTH